MCVRHSTAGDALSGSAGTHQRRIVGNDRLDAVAFCALSPRWIVYRPDDRSHAASRRLRSDATACERAVQRYLVGANFHGALDYPSYGGKWTGELWLEERSRAQARVKTLDLGN